MVCRSSRRPLFNAAFFAGIEIAEYQCHTLYIDRYPYGREATLAFPEPDLKINNTSPYGVLIWTSLHGHRDHRHALLHQVGRRASRRAQYKSIYGRGCTAVTTERTRTFRSTATPRSTRFTGSYVPGEGVTC